MPRFYDPNLNNEDDHYRDQKRVPKGHEGGGQWTAEDFHLTRATPSPMRALPRVVPPPPRRGIPPVDPTAPQVTPPSFNPDGPLPLSIEALVESLRDPANLYERLSLRNTVEKRAVATFRSREFLSGDETAAQVRDLDVDQVKAVCKKFDKVQSLLDLADAATPPTRPGFNEAQRGTDIHKFVADRINGPVDKNTPPRNPAFRAETSVVKTLEALEQQEPNGLLSQKTLREKGGTADYARAGTIRFDVLEFVNNNTVCVYDIKTADALLSFKRMEHFAELLLKYGNKQIIVTQMKPSHMYRR